MDISKIDELKRARKWRDLLRELPEGDHTLTFESIDNIKVCKATAYDLNSDKAGRKYTFNVNKDEKKAIIHVREITNYDTN